MKENIKKILNILAFTSIFVAFTGVSLIYTNSLLLNLPVSYNLIAISFLIVLFIYNINKMTDINEDEINYPERIKFIKKYKTGIVSISLFAGILAFVIAFFVKPIIVLFILIPLIGVILYSFYPIRLKRILFIKNLWVSFLWSLSVTILPSIYWNRIDLLFSPSSFFIFLFIFTKGIGNTITFDIRDISGDRMYKIRTVPLIFGVNKTKILLYLINIISFSILLIATLEGFVSHIGYFVSLAAFYTFVYIYLIGRKNMKFITDILADGEFIIIGFLAFIGSFFD